MVKEDGYFPVGVCLEAVLFVSRITNLRMLITGGYTATLAAAIWIWLYRRSKFVGNCDSTFSGLLYFSSITLMWVVAFAHICVSIHRLLRVYLVEQHPSSQSKMTRLMDARIWDATAHMMLTTIIIFIGDVLVIYRTFMIWDRNFRVILVPVLLLVTYLVVNTISIYALRHPEVFTRKTADAWSYPVFPLVFAQNVMTTGLLFYKLNFPTPRGKPSKDSVNFKLVAQHAKGTVAASSVAWLLVETAMFYTLELLVIIALGAIKHPAKSIASLMLVPTLGIVFVMLAVRVHTKSSAKKQNTSDISMVIPKHTTDRTTSGGGDVERQPRRQSEQQRQHQQLGTIATVPRSPRGLSHPNSSPNSMPIPHTDDDYIRRMESVKMSLQLPLHLALQRSSSTDSIDSEEQEQRQEDSYPTISTRRTSEEYC